MTERTVVVLRGQHQSKGPLFYLAEPRGHPEADTSYNLLLPLVSFTPAAGNQLHIPQHGLEPGQEVALIDPAGGRLPAGLAPGNSYYAVVDNNDPDHIRLSGTPGGPPLLFNWIEQSQGGLFVWPKTIEMSFGSAPPSEPVVKEKGDILLRGLSRHPAVGGRLQQLARDRSDRYRPIYLQFQSGPAVLESFPWEALYDTEAKFFALDQRFPVIRQKNPMTRLTSTFAYDPPLRILAILAAGAPSLDSSHADGGLRGMNVDATPEWEALWRATRDADVEMKVLTCQKDLQDKINRLGNWRFTAEQTQDLNNISRELRKFGPQIVHLFGHGNAKSGAIVFANYSDYRQSEPGSIQVTPEYLRQFSSDMAPIWITVLNACRSGNTEEGRESISGKLANFGFPVVIGMSSDVASQHTRIFTETYYRSLFDLLSPIEPWVQMELDWPGNFFRAREAIRAECGMDAEKCPYWTIPLLYTQPEPFNIVRLAPDDPARQGSPDKSRLINAQTRFGNQARQRNITMESLRKEVMDGDSSRQS